MPEGQSLDLLLEEFGIKLPRVHLDEFEFREIKISTQTKGETSQRGANHHLMPWSDFKSFRAVEVLFGHDDVRAPHKNFLSSGRPLLHKGKFLLDDFSCELCVDVFPLLIGFIGIALIVWET